jgi:hypothetical protein
LGQGFSDALDELTQLPDEVIYRKLWTGEIWPET